MVQYIYYINSIRPAHRDYLDFPLLPLRTLKSARFFPPKQNIFYCVWLPVLSVKNQCKDCLAPEFPYWVQELTVWLRVPHPKFLSGIGCNMAACLRLLALSSSARQSPNHQSRALLIILSIPPHTAWGTLGGGGEGTRAVRPTAPQTLLLHSNLVHWTK